MIRFIMIYAILICVPAYAANPGDVVFNELMWMGDLAGDTHEWIELRNMTDTEIDLTGWQISKLGNDGEELMLGIPSGSIPPKGYFLISNNSAADSNIAVEPNLVDASVSLPNTKLQLKLYDGVWDAGGNLIDTADDGIGAPLAGDKELKKSMGRNEPQGGGTLAENWHTAEISSGWDEGAQEFGTPQSSQPEQPAFEVPIVIFNEIMWMGDFASASNEWIELYNTTEEEIDISGWQITRLATEGEVLMLTIPEGIIPPKGYFLIANSSAADSNIAVKPNLVDASVSLPNTKLQLKLHAGDREAGANLIDTADDGTGKPLAGDAELKKSMLRNEPVGDGTLAESWQTSEERSGWDEGAQEFGTPQGSQPIQPPFEVPTVIFNEIMWTGDFTSASNEWIELYNTTEEEIDISGWQITRLATEGEVLMLTIPEGVIPPKGYFLIANSSAKDSNIAVEPNLVDASVSLPNTKLRLKLYAGDWEAGANLIDIVDDGAGKPLAGDAELKKSMARSEPVGDGTLAESWQTSEKSSGWDEDALEFGTPESSLPKPIPFEVPIVIFAELMWMGDFASASNEWIKLRNITDREIDISGWQISKLTDDGEVLMLTIPDGTVIPPKGYFFIANSNAKNSNIAVKPDFVTADVSLANNRLQLKLYDGNWEADGSIIDTADDGTGKPLAGDAELNKSMVRNELVGDGTLAESWHTSEERSGWDEGAQEFGTPQSSTPAVKEQPCDVNQDGKVDLLDLVIVGLHFGESPPTDLRADVNGDNTIDIADLVLIGVHFGE